LKDEMLAFAVFLLLGGAQIDALEKGCKGRSFWYKAQNVKKYDTTGTKMLCYSVSCEE
jgi:hypothetical protein